MATLADIAAALNLNKTTVSKALNDSSDISRATKQRVLEEAERVGYTKHKRKKVPVERRNLVGIICPEIVSGYYARIATHLQAHLRKKGFQALLALSAFSPELEKEQLAFLTQLNPSGIIVVTEQRDISNSIHDIPGAQSIPAVVMGLNYASREYDVVSVDETYGIRALVEHLAKQGHRRIAFIGDALAQSRLHALRQALAQKDIALPEEYVATPDVRNEPCGYEGMKRLLALKTPPTAVVAGYDTIALGAYRAIAEAGLRVPEDIALTGFDDADFCPFLPCALTSVDCDVAAQCRVAVAILSSKILQNGETFTQSVAITPRLMARESSKALARDFGSAR